MNRISFLNRGYAFKGLLAVCTGWFVLDLVGNPEDQFFGVTALIITYDNFAIIFIISP